MRVVKRGVHHSRRVASGFYIVSNLAGAGFDWFRPFSLARELFGTFKYTNNARRLSLSRKRFLILYELCTRVDYLAVPHVPDG